VSDTSGEKAYPRDFEPNTSHANAVALLDKSDTEAGLVLDIGCGNAPAAEPLRDRGFDYVGLDVDKPSLDGLRDRGFEIHKLDLGVAPARLVKKLREIVGDRRVVAILALDVLEHVIEPRSVVETLAAVAESHPGCSLLVSIPNITHRDIATRLMLAHWDMTPVGLLDDTHLRFFSPEGLERLFAGTGWRQVDALDTTSEYTEQFTMLRTPAVQPGAPIGDFFRRIRTQAAPHATTYQYVRRLTLDATAVEHPAERSHSESPFLSIVITGLTGEDDRPPLLDDLDRQSDADFELVDAGPAWDFTEVNAGALKGSGHYLAFLDATDRVGPDYVSALRKGASDADDPIAVDCLVRIDAVLLDEAEVGTALPFEAIVGDRVAIEPDGFDLLRSDVLGRTALSAYAVPSSVVRTLGVRFETALGPAAPSVFLARAVEMCSLRGVGDLQVAVDGRRVRDADDDLDAVREGLGSGAFLLPPGGVARLAAQRRTLVKSLAAERSMREELEDLRPRVIFAEGERERLAIEIDAMLNTKLWRYGQLLRKVYARSRRLIASQLHR
jgi:2-polyprenyl-3-methyl-5-hydroxy-6-metoxy-1,4-benzoquinol methylase